VTIPETRLKIAVFIDFDNIEIGVKSTLNTNFDIGTVLDALKERGEVVSKIAYSDWKRAGDYSRSLSQHAIKMVQRNLTPGGDKNGADINLALDALEMAFTHPHINSYVIVGGDSDFITLVEKLKQYDKKVMVVGGRSFTSVIMQRNCHEFIAYENLIGGRTQGRRLAERARTPRAASQASGIEQAIPLVERALEVLTDREVSPQLGLLKSTLLQLDSTFSERSFGASSFRDFAEKLEAAGLVTLRHSGRNILVELKEAGGNGADAPAAPEPAAPPAEPVPPRAAPRAPAADQTVEVVGGIADVRRILAKSKPQRFPMYIRNIKQLLRQTEPGFDERKYGFANLVDLLRAAQREGMLRLERDRQGALRVFQGQAWPQAPSPAAAASEPETLTDRNETGVLAPEDPGIFLEETPAETPAADRAIEGVVVDEQPAPAGRRGRKARSATDGRAPRARKTSAPKSRTRNPRTSEPGTPEPGTRNPGTPEPGTRNLGTRPAPPPREAPEAGNLGTRNLGTRNPGTRNPEPRNPETPEPGTPEPGTRNPDSAVPKSRTGARKRGSRKAAASSKPEV